MCRPAPLRMARSSARRCPHLEAVDPHGVALAADDGVARVRRQVRRAGWAGTGAAVTKALIAINVLVFLAEIGTGSGATGAGGGGSVVNRFALDGPDVANGGWWRLITAGFLHANVLHIGLNMLILWLVGSPLEEMLGRGRYLLLYFVSLLAGSAGALPQAPRLPP